MLRKGRQQKQHQSQASWGLWGEWPYKYSVLWAKLLAKVTWDWCLAIGPSKAVETKVGMAHSSDLA